ncbi:hypothetical protein QM797_21210 [Rhodococcus sp. IEGM 1381]|uniref:DUF6924 domain-containing protein n=1 Tax=Rhodococcus sp. IEGM 1381 TaxID=3047085 RepID=UPI0024B8260D|nr:hypothetical protein [Rhodococcus sp. IEGM 1381]MDI9897247.1 hypothetical protein [Rhodococcus sp. IEGM 1381]
MPTLPEGQSLLIRTHFGDAKAWELVAREAQAMHTQAGGIEAQSILTVVDNPEFVDLSVADLVGSIDSPLPDYFFVVDRHACDDAEHPILVVAPKRDPSDAGAPFRVVPRLLATIESNLAVANLSFEELRDDSDSDGVYRGAPSTNVTEREISNETLLDAAYAADDSPTVMQLRVDLSLSSATTVWTALVRDDLVDSYNAIVSQPYRLELIVGYEDALEVLSQGGSGLAIHVPAPRSYWSIFLDPDDLSLRAAMKVFYPQQANPRRRRAANS